MNFMSIRSISQLINPLSVRNLLIWIQFCTFQASILVILGEFLFLYVCLLIWDLSELMGLFAKWQDVYFKWGIYECIISIRIKLQYRISANITHFSHNTQICSWIMQRNCGESLFDIKKIDSPNKTFTFFLSIALFVKQKMPFFPFSASLKYTDFQ